MATWKVTKQNVNSKRLCDEITKIIEEGVLNMGIIWRSDSHRIAFVELLEDMLEEGVKDGYIDQWNVVCDFRNNTVEQMEKNIYVLDIYYRQTHMLNTTNIRYTIEDDDEDLLDFSL